MSKRRKKTTKAEPEKAEPEKAELKNQDAVEQTVETQTSLNFDETTAEPEENVVAEEVEVEAEEINKSETEVLVPETALKEAKQQAQEFLELAQRTQAELENYRKRVIRDRKIEYNQARASLLKDLIMPVNDFDRALAEAKNNCDFDSLFSGLKLARENLWKALERAEFKKINAASGQPFDPSYHEAMLQMPSPDIPVNCIVQELETGYCLGELVLRPAKVTVSIGIPDAAEEEKAEPEELEQESVEE